MPVINNAIELTLYLVGIDEEAALGNMPFDSPESAESYARDNGGLTVFTVTAYIDPATIDAEYVWADPSGHGWIDAWNGWYDTEAEAREQGATGIGRPRVLTLGEGIVDEAEMGRRLG